MDGARILQQRIQLLEQTSQVGHVGGWRWSLAERTMNWTDETYRIHGLDPGVHRSDSEGQILQSLDCYRPEDRSRVLDAFDACAREGVTYDLEFPFTPFSGEPTWIRTQGMPWFEEGKVVAVVGTIMEIGHRHRRENLLQARFRILEAAPGCADVRTLLTMILDEAEALTSSQIGFFHFVDPDQTHLTLQTWSTRTLEVFCRAQGSLLHYPVSQAGIWVDGMVGKRTLVCNDYPSAVGKKGLPEGHAAVRRFLSIPVVRSDRLVAIVGVGNKPTDYTEWEVETVSRLADLCWESVEQLRANLALEAALREKETLLREVHHRVKNQFCAVQGLVSLQSSEAEDPAVQEALKKTSGHIDTLAQLYQRLCAGPDWSAVDLGPYLEGLCRDIAGLYPEGTRIERQVRVDPVRIAPSRLFLIGTIVNEWVVNSFKHAFTPGTPGTLRLEARLEDGELVLEYGDSGQGPGVPRPTGEGGMGTGLVELLADHLGGRLEGAGEPGLFFRLRLSVEAPSAP